MRVEDSTLFIKNGFTHHPQEQETFRFFKGDLRLPTRIIMLDGNGTLSFDVMAWLSEQGVSLICLNWRGQVTSMLGGAGYAADSAKVEWQRLMHSDPKRRTRFASQLIADKIRASVKTARIALPKSSAPNAALKRLAGESKLLELQPPSSIDDVLGIEGRAAALYFAMWKGLPVRWKATRRHPVPEMWQTYWSRSSMKAGDPTNEGATHPVNAMLNYGYAVLQSRMHSQAIAKGFDPTLGILHKQKRGTPAFIFDIMEPERPKIDAAILEFVREYSFSAADFVLTSRGTCRLGPQLAKMVVAMVDRSIGEPSTMKLAQ